MALIEQTRKFSLSLFPTRPSSIEVLHPGTNHRDVSQSRIVSTGIFNALLQYVDTIAAHVLAFFAIFAERTCTCCQWVTERTHQSVQSTAAPKINDRETAEKAGVRNICIEADRNQRTLTVNLAG